MGYDLCLVATKRRFAEISHIELLVLVERYENVVYCGEKSFHLS